MLIFALLDIIQNLDSFYVLNPLFTCGTQKTESMRCTFGAWSRHFILLRLMPPWISQYLLQVATNDEYDDCIILLLI